MSSGTGPARCATRRAVASDMVLPAAAARRERNSTICSSGSGPSAIRSAVLNSWSVALDEQSLYEMLLGAGSHQADRRVGVDHRLQYSGEAVVEIHDGLKVVEHQGCWRLHGQLGEKFEDVG